MLYALVLAGGRGERLRPYTDDKPKPMVELNGKPLLWYQLSWLKKNGVTNAVILGGYRIEAIKQYFGDGENVGIALEYIEEKEPLGRGGAYRQGLLCLPDSANLVIATNGDILTNQALQPILNLHQLNPETMATIMLTPLISQYGIVSCDDSDRVISFLEKPQLPYWVNAGVYVFSKHITKLMPEKGDHETSTFPDLAEKGKLSGFKSERFWKGIDTAKDIQEVSNLLHTIWNQD